MTRVVRNPNQILQHGPNFRFENSEIVILDRSSLCQASLFNLDSNIYRDFVET